MKTQQTKSRKGDFLGIMKSQKAKKTDGRTY